MARNDYIFKSQLYVEINVTYLQNLFSWQRLQNSSSTSYCDQVLFIYFSIWDSFHDYSRFTGQQRKGEAISLTPLFHFHTLQRHLVISRENTAGSSPLHIISNRSQTGNLWFPSKTHYPLSYTPFFYWTRY